MGLNRKMRRSAQKTKMMSVNVDAALEAALNEREAAMIKEVVGRLLTAAVLNDVYNYNALRKKATRAQASIDGVVDYLYKIKKKQLTREEYETLCEVRKWMKEYANDAEKDAMNILENGEGSEDLKMRTNKHDCA